MSHITSYRYEKTGSRVAHWCEVLWCAVCVCGRPKKHEWGDSFCPSCYARIGPRLKWKVDTARRQVWFLAWWRTARYRLAGQLGGLECELVSIRCQPRERRAA